MPGNLTQANLANMKQLAPIYTTIEVDPSPRSFKAHFGVSALTSALVWQDIQQDAKKRGKELQHKPWHLLWALHFIKAYPLIEVGCSFCKTSPHTYRRHTQELIKALGKMDRVSNHRHHEN